MRPKTGSNARVFETRLRVRYAETDQMNVVYHSNYIIWFEVGRVELMRELGFTYREMEQQDGYHLPVAEVRCRFKQAAHYDDMIVIRTHISALRSALIQFHYDLFRDGSDGLLAEGESTHLVVGRNMQRASLPEKYMKVFRPAAGLE